MLEHCRTIPDDVFIQKDARVGIAQQARQRRLAVEEWTLAQIVAVMLDQVEGGLCYQQHKRPYVFAKIMLRWQQEGSGEER